MKDDRGWLSRQVEETEQLLEGWPEWMRKLHGISAGEKDGLKFRLEASFTDKDGKKLDQAIEFFAPRSILEKFGLLRLQSIILDRLDRLISAANGDGTITSVDGYCVTCSEDIIFPNGKRSSGEIIALIQWR